MNVLNKNKFYYTEAERLYVEEQMMLEEIAEIFHLSVRTVKYWKNGNDWNAKKKEFLDSKQVYLDDFEIFVRDILSKIGEDLDNGRKISTGRYYSFANSLDRFVKDKRAEAICRKFLEK